MVSHTGIPISIYDVAEIAGKGQRLKQNLFLSNQKSAWKTGIVYLIQIQTVTLVVTMLINEIDDDNDISKKLAIYW